MPRDTDDPQLKKWYERFNAESDVSLLNLSKVILSHINGYGTEYGYDPDADAADLEAAVTILIMGATIKATVVESPDGTTH